CADERQGEAQHQEGPQLALSPAGVDELQYVFFAGWRADGLGRLGQWCNGGHRPPLDESTRRFPTPASKKMLGPVGEPASLSSLSACSLAESLFARSRSSRGPGRRR